MDFLLEFGKGHFYSSLIVYGMFLIICVIGLFALISTKVDDVSDYFFDKRIFSAMFLFGLLFFGFLFYKSFENLDEYNTVSSKGSVEQYYNVEKVGKTLVFSRKTNSKVLKENMSAVIEEETDSDYILVADNQKVSIPKNIVK